MLDDQTKLCPHCGKPLLSHKAERELEYMRKHAPRRGGYMFEGARPRYESGKYSDEEITELLRAGAIAPHSDPLKGWIVKW